MFTANLSFKTVALVLPGNALSLFRVFLLMITPAFTIQLPAETLAIFNTAPRYAIGSDTFDSAFADFDGDGNLDIASVNALTNTPLLSIAYGRSDGSFEPLITFSSSIIPYSIAAGDLNQDGKPDLVVGAYYQNRLATFLNLGNRQFALPTVTFPPNPPYPNVGEFFDLAIGDFDGDGKSDVVAVQDQQGKRLRFLHYNEQGSLSVFATLNQYGAQNSYEGEIAVGDLNNDGRADIVFVGGGPFALRNITFVFGQPPGGTLSFVHGFDIPDEAEGISITDLDNDGDRDIAIAFLDTSTPIEHSLRPLINNGNGLFTMGARIPLAYPFETHDITTGDYNNDGNADMAALLGGGLVMTLNGNGDGTFSTTAIFATSGSRTIHSADFNHDGRSDLATVTTILSDYNSISVLLNDYARGFKAPRPALWGPDFIDAADFNNDNRKDLVSSWATVFTSTSGVDILVNDGRFGFLLPELHHPSPAGLAGMKVGDFNGDGNMDAVSAHDYSGRGLAAYLGNGEGVLGNAIRTELLEGLTANLIVGDFDSDGDDDVFAIDRAERGLSLLSDGDGTFSSTPGLTIQLPANVPFELQKGDFNSDGKLDLVINMNYLVELWLGDGTGRFARSSSVIPELEHAVPGDFNGDGKLDLAGADFKSISGVLGDGVGGFGQVFSSSRVGSRWTFGNLVSADFDNDGFDDLAFFSEDPRGNLVVLASGGNTPSWREPVFYEVGGARRSLIVQDFNGDSRPDLGYLGFNTRGILYNVMGEPPEGCLFDYDGDGKADVSVRRHTDNIWYLLQGTAGYTAMQFGEAGDRITPADYDGDGKTDVAVFRPLTGTWFVFASQSQTFQQFGWGAAGDLPVPTDRDNDGKADLVVFRPSNNTWYTRYANGTFATTEFGVAGDKPLVGDFDADGIGDIALFRPSNNNWYIIKSSLGFFIQTWGEAGDIPVPADFDGDGATDQGVFRPSTGQWFLSRTTDGFGSQNWGQAGDIPVAADYDGDGKADVAVFRPTNGTWYIVNSSTGQLIQQFGQAGDVPTQSSYIF